MSSAWALAASIVTASVGSGSATVTSNSPLTSEPSLAVATTLTVPAFKVVNLPASSIVATDSSLVDQATSLLAASAGNTSTA